jgi:acyl dehydratase
MITATTDLAVGTELPPLDAGEITRATLAMFGPASGDYHPIHLDLDVARSAGMDDVFAHGMLSMAYLGRLLTSWVDQRRIRSLTARFTAITPIHARPVCTGVVSAVDREQGTATVDVAVTLADGTVTLTGSAVVALEDNS